MVYEELISFELGRYPPVAVSRKLEADSLDSVREISFITFLLDRTALPMIVEAADRKLHKPASLPDTTDEVLAPGDERPFR